MIKIKASKNGESTMHLINCPKQKIPTTDNQLVERLIKSNGENLEHKRSLKPKIANCRFIHKEEVDTLIHTALMRSFKILSYYEALQIFLYIFIFTQYICHICFNN